MSNAFVRKLERLAPLAEDAVVMLDASLRNPRSYAKGAEMLRDGDSPSKALVLIDGLAIRSKALDDGRRQVLSIMVPGDFYNLLRSPYDKVDCSIEAIERCVVAELTADDIAKINAHLPIVQALSRALQIEAAIASQWLIGVGRKTAEERMAHLFCELLYRLRDVQRAGADSYCLPLNLHHVSDIIGTSTVHACRAAQGLRKRNLMRRRPRRFIELSVKAIANLGAFDPAYLGPSVAAPSALPRHQAATSLKLDATMLGERLFSRSHDSGGEQNARDIGPSGRTGRHPLSGGSHVPVDVAGSRSGDLRYPAARDGSRLHRLS